MNQISRFSRSVRTFGADIQWRALSGMEVPARPVDFERARGRARDILLVSAQRVAKRRVRLHRRIVALHRIAAGHIPFPERRRLKAERRIAPLRRMVARALRHHLRNYRTCKAVGAVDPSWSRVPLKFILQVGPDGNPWKAIGFDHIAESSAAAAPK